MLGFGWRDSFRIVRVRVSFRFDVSILLGLQKCIVI